MLYVTYLILLLVGQYYCDINNETNSIPTTVTSLNNITTTVTPLNNITTTTTTIQPPLSITNITEQLLGNLTTPEDTTFSVLITEIDVEQLDNATESDISNFPNFSDLLEEPIILPGAGLFNYYLSLGTPVLGANCTLQDECKVTRSMCLDNLCQCAEGYVASSDKMECLQKVKLGKSCKENIQCTAGSNLPDGDALCVSFRCVCASETVFSGGTCLRNKYIGHSCQSDEECLTENSQCQQGVCACSSDMVPTPDNKFCIRAFKSMNNSKDCSEDIQCQQFMGDSAHCADKKCQCKERTHYNSTMCVTDLRLGEACTANSDCQTSDVSGSQGQRECIFERCGCSAGFTEVAGEDTCINGASGTFSRFMVLLTLIFIVTVQLM